jgi:hypothetical protein
MSRVIARRRALALFDLFIGKYYKKGNPIIEVERNAIRDNKCPNCGAEVIFYDDNNWFPICSRAFCGVDLCEKTTPTLHHPDWIAFKLGVPIK